MFYKNISIEKVGKKMKNLLKSKSGITLIALIITDVVIMLILAGVAISVIVDGEGLFSRVRSAATEYENAAQDEASQIKTLMNEIDKYLAETPIPPKDETENVAVIPSSIAKVGDFVNYSVDVDVNENGIIDEGETFDKWRILHFDMNGNMEIVCYNGPAYEIGQGRNSVLEEDIAKTKSDYSKMIKLLNEASVQYKNGEYGEDSRHLGSNPLNKDSYAEIDESYLRYYSEFDSTTAKPTENLEYIDQTHYMTDALAVGNFEGEKKLSGESGVGNHTWLAARLVEAESNRTVFYTNAIYPGENGDYIGRISFLLFKNDSISSTAKCLALAPVVSLESGIKLKSGIGNGSEEQPYHLTKV